MFKIWQFSLHHLQIQSVCNPCYSEHHPVSGITSVIHFSIKENSLKYLDLRRTRLYVKCKIVDKNGDPPPPVVDYSQIAF